MGRETRRDRDVGRETRRRGRPSSPRGQTLTYLTRCRHSDGARPVVIHVSHLVRQSLKVVRFESRGVVYHSIMSGGYCALPHMLTHKEEVIPRC